MNPLVTLWRNAFGSDELDHYTAEYAWMANQMAHAMMGFFLSVCVVGGSRFLRLRKIRLAAAEGKPEPPPSPAWRRTDALVAYLVLSIILKEVVDITTDSIRDAGTPVTTNYWNIICDSFTDAMFWWSGMFLALCLMQRWVFDPKEQKQWRRIVGLTGLGVCLTLGVVTGKVWVNQKRTFDRSGMPFNYERLNRILRKETGEPNSNLDLRPIKLAGDEARLKEQYDRLKEFQKRAQEDKGEGIHYLIVGGRPQDRSRLAVSMGCEFAFRLRFEDWRDGGAKLTRVFYLSAAKAMENPKVFDDMVEGKLNCVILDDLDVVMVPPLEIALEHYPTNPQALSPSHARRALAQVAPELFTKFGTDQLPQAFAAWLGADKAKRKVEGAAPANRLLRRQKVFGALGERVNLQKINTVWVLAAGGEGVERGKELQNPDYLAWRFNIAQLLGVKETDLREIQVEHPD